KGFGEALVKHAENDVRARGGKIIWFNAREVAVGFYKKLGYEIIGEPFDIADIGKHYVMYKKLDTV
ncbi:MAG: GNAT family N-acetyltransferase, partial [Flavobacteriaceae bacterium]